MSQIELIKQRVAAQPQAQAAAQWYSALPARDQWVVKAVGWLVALALVYLIVFAPLIKANHSAHSKLDKNLATYNLIAENADKFGGARTPAASTGGPILPLVTNSARNDKIKLGRYEQDGSNGIRIWIDAIEFDVFISWVEALQARHGVRVSQITVDTTDRPGWVDVRATLTNS